METFVVEPALFDTYIAFDPSLWWNDRSLVRSAGVRLRAQALSGKTVYLASSGNAELRELMQSLTAALDKSKAQDKAQGFRWFHEPMPQETHATIYHPAALRAFRTLFKPTPAR